MHGKEGIFLSCVRPSFLPQLKRGALIDTGSWANASPECLFKEFKHFNANLLILEKSFISVGLISVPQVSIEKGAK